MGMSENEQNGLVLTLQAYTSAGSTPMQGKAGNSVICI